MKKSIIFMILVLCGINSLCAQNVLPGYRGFWERDRKVTVFEMIEYYPDRLPFLRNEIYARYGRPFVNQVYRDYFKAQSWYQERSDFSDSWLSQNDQANAALIISLESSTRSLDAFTALVLKNIEYTDGTASLTFTSRMELVGRDRRVDFGPYATNWRYEETRSWVAMGDWVLVYSYMGYGGVYNVVAYKLDHSSRRIVSYDTEEWLDGEKMQNIIRVQGRPK